MRAAIERAVPHGIVTTNGRALRGSWAVTPASVTHAVGRACRSVWDASRRSIRASSETDPQTQLGTLGGGNHFIEICLDTEQTVWVMLHSGSRGIGNRHRPVLHRAGAGGHDESTSSTCRIATWAYLVEGTEHFDDYVEAMSWAQDYAAENRERDDGVGAARAAG